MDPISNPYSPGAGTLPPVLAGRDDVIDDFRVIIGRATSGNSFQPMILSGLRGVGKTVLLLRFRTIAREAGWVAEIVETRPDGDLRMQVAEALPPLVRTVNRHWRNKELAQRIGRVAASFARNVQATVARSNFQLQYEPEPGVADSGDLETDLVELFVAMGEGAREEKVGATLLIDELQDVPAEQLSPIVGAAHRLNQEALPVVIAGAGLPRVGRALSEARSYSERLFSIHPISQLEEEATRDAFAAPTQSLGVAFDTEALEHLVAISEGYPFFIQVYGKHTWDIAEASPIDREDVALASFRAYQELVDSFFRPRYDRATPAERRYLHAMADLNTEPVQSSDVALSLGFGIASQTSQQRDGLLSKGLIYAPERGQLSFTVPQMGQYLRDLTDRP